MRWERKKVFLMSLKIIRSIKVNYIIISIMAMENFLLIILSIEGNLNKDVDMEKEKNIFLKLDSPSPVLLSSISLQITKMPLKSQDCICSKASNFELLQVELNIIHSNH